MDSEVINLFVHDVRQSFIPAAPYDVYLITDLEIGAIVAIDGVDDFAVFFELAKEAALVVRETGDELCLAAVGVIMRRCVSLEQEEEHHRENDKQKNNS